MPLSCRCGQGALAWMAQSTRLQPVADRETDRGGQWQVPSVARQILS